MKENRKRQEQKTAENIPHIQDGIKRGMIAC
jgi:hypothetical protein